MKLGILGIDGLFPHFLETFEEVRANFQGVFRKLFGGGRADLRLEEGVDVLEAGIDIVARPPGRRVHRGRDAADTGHTGHP